MKKYLFHILTVTLLASILLGGCSAGSSVKTSSGQSTSAISSSGQNVSATMPESMKKALEMTDQKIADRFGNLDICLGDNLLFTDSKDISSKTLFTFYCYITTCDEYPKDYFQKWYNKNDAEYHVPVDNIVNVLNKYFDRVNFDPKRISEYNAKHQTIDCDYINGFGGANFPKFSKKEIISNDTLKVTISYYDPDYKSVKYSKIYTIRYTDDGYKYLSIIKQ
jgi:hypothetical protein